MATLLGILLPQSALAALEVQFEATPLFLNADIKPGDVVSRTVTVTNTGSESEQIIFDFQNEFSDGLADVMELAVTTDESTLVDNFFTELFALGEIDLGTLTADTSETYTFTAFLDPAIGNEYQLTELGFDLVIGFAGGETVTDGGGSGGSGGGGGGSADDSDFSLFNEAVTTPTNTSALLTWNTNEPATSYAVCGNLESGPFVLDADDALFGYEFDIDEDTSKGLSHELLFTGLSIGQYECRVASREETGDEFTVSGALPFAFLPGGQVEGITTTATPQPVINSNIFTPTGQVAGVSNTTGGKGTFGGLTYEEFRAEIDERRAREQVAGAADSSSSTTQNEDLLRERPTDAFASTSSPNDSLGGFLADNWWWLLLVGGLGIVSARFLAKLLVR